MIAAISWYLLLVLLGWSFLPLAHRFLGRLPDKGFGFAKALALLFWAYLYWILGSFGLLKNNLSGLFLSLGLLLALSAWLLQGGRRAEIAAWIREHRSLILTQELLFLLAFFLMVFLRSLAPEANSTEKPMELAFINSILQTSSMPPNDPWLSGFSISYYYLGFLMVSMLAQVTNTLGSISFNLGLAMIFALSAVAAYSLAYNILALIRADRPRANRFAALLAPIFVLILGNFEALLEGLHGMHFFWSFSPDGFLVSDFWSWLNIKDLVNPPAAEAAFQPRNYGQDYWWWWRSSRVIHDINFAGFSQELIDEFPAFSFILGDLHPHVLSIPFSLAAIGAGLNIWLGDLPKKAQGFLGLALKWQDFLFTALLLGALAFLNIWDFPIYLVFIAGVFLFAHIRDKQWSMESLLFALKAFAAFALAGLILYFPYYWGFNSQAAGILPNLLNPTRGVQLWVMFGALFLPLFGYYISQQQKSKRSRTLFPAFLISLLLLLALLAFIYLMAWLFAALLPDSSVGQYLLNGLGAPDLQSLIQESISRRIGSLGTLVTLFFLLSLPLIGILAHILPSRKSADNPPSSDARGKSFIFLLGIFAALLIIAPEFVFLRDQFGTRMNTVFKFFFQAWIVLGVIASIGAVLWIEQSKRLGKIVAWIVVLASISAAALFPIFAFPDHYRSTEGVALSLDASSFLSASELEAAAWLRNAPDGIIVEAVGNAYTGYARYATHSGKQGVLGWPGHESQWRGGNADFAPREGDIAILYSSLDWSRAKEIVERYDIGYVIVGALEYSSYDVGESKFASNLDLVFQNDAVTIYQVP